MGTERRNSPRFSPHDLKASITVEHPSYSRFEAAGEVIDISCTGIKIKLDAPFVAETDCTLKIQLALPETGIPLTISGIIKHRSPSFEFGLQYADHAEQKILDDLIFECTKRCK